MAHGAGPEHADPIIVLPYLGYGTARRVRLRGRVLKDEGLRPARDLDSRWRNLVSFYKRLESDEVPGALVCARLGAHRAQATSNREGYFSIVLDGLALRAGWHAVELELPHHAVKAKGRVLVPYPRARFGVVSDIDDTVVWTHVRNKLKMILALALSNARTRKPFPGVAAFYRALHAGVNPIFYVSKSPWNLYAPLVEFLELQALPAGPLALRDFGLRMNRSHKAQAIVEILETYPRMRFVLIGDSGEEDPEVYAGVVRRFPERIRVIYIRSVNLDAKRIEKIQALVEEVARTGCQLVLVPDAESAAAHAAGEGLIRGAELQAIRSDKRSDERTLSKPAASSGTLK